MWYLLIALTILFAPFIILQYIGPIVYSIFADEYKWEAETPETGVWVNKPDGSRVLQMSMCGSGAVVFEAEIRQYVAESMRANGVRQADIKIEFRDRLIRYEYKDEQRDKR